VLPSKTVQVEVTSPYPEVLSMAQALLAANDLDGLVSLLPIRETALRTQVASALSLRSNQDYEAVARVCIRDSDKLQQQLRGKIGSLI